MTLRLVNPFELSGKWYKGNFHVHTRTSDGGVWVEDAVRLYKQHGYNVLAITDHINTNDIRGLSDKNMLVINGAELHPPLPGRSDVEYHICAIGLWHGFPFSRRSWRDVQACLDEVHRAGAVSILAHPKELSMNPLTEMVNLKRVSAVEVWTTLSELDGERGSSEPEWATCMEHGMFLSATACDDTHWAPRHGWAEAFGGATWLKMRSLTVANVLKALKTGATYASAGPRIHDFRMVGGKVTLKCSPVIKIQFKHGIDEWKYRWAKAGRTITSFTFDLPTDWPWVRAVVTDACSRRAWTNPIRRVAP